MVKRSSILSSLSTPSSSNGVPTTVKEGKAYKGVRMRSWGSWVSEIRAPNQKTRIWLGSYSSPEAAARAYDAALLCLKGSSASLNFPNSGLFYHPPAFLSPKSIQKFAAAAANGNTEEAVSTTMTPVTPSMTTSNVSSPLSDTITSLMEEEPIQSRVDDFGFFESPTCMNQIPMNHWATIDATVECDEYEFDINLWSF